MVKSGSILGFYHFGKWLFLGDMVNLWDRGRGRGCFLGQGRYPLGGIRWEREREREGTSLQVVALQPCREVPVGVDQGSKTVRL